MLEAVHGADHYPFFEPPEVTNRSPEALSGL
jgi:hypothetical protein